MTLSLAKKLEVIEKVMEWEATDGFKLTEQRAMNFVNRCARHAESSIGKRINQPKAGAVGVILENDPIGPRGRGKSVVMQFAAKIQKADGSTVDCVIERFPR